MRASGQPEHFDALVVGGGPAGSTCARQLVAAGMRVAVLDKADFPRDKVCAGWITPPVLDLLSIDADAYGKQRVIQPIRRFQTSSAFQSPVDTGYGSVVSYGIRRFEFDHYLLSRCGAELFPGQAVREIGFVPERGHWLVNGRFSAPLLVGAGGHGCPVSRHLGNPLGSRVQAVAAQEIEVEMDTRQAMRCPVAGDQPVLVFNRALNGYGWVFRKQNWLNIGYGCEEKGNIRPQVEEFYRELVQRELIPEGLPAHFKGHSYLLYRHAARKVVADGVLLIGDAAGLAYTQSGEGIRPAIESGVLAARVVLECRGDYRKARLGDFADKLTNRFGTRPASPRDDKPAGPLRRYLAGVLLGNAWFTRRVLIDRWFLHRHQSRLESPAG